MPAMSFAATAFRISAGVIVWAVHFGVVYGLTAIACARGAPSLAVWTIGIATLVAAAIAAAVLVREWRRREAFEAWLAAGLAALALVAIVWEAVPVLIVPVCG